MKQNTFVYMVGTAGSGKSTFSSSFQQWCMLRGLETVLVNLDPGAESLPYDPDVDIRDWISITDVMSEYGLGPNGAQVAAADMVALNLAEVEECIRGFQADYILMDTPGQLELFVFRESGKHLVRHFGLTQSMVCYLLDPVLAKSASGFVTQLLLSVTANVRLGIPQVNILSKCDLIEDEMLAQIIGWSDDPQNAYSAVINEEPSVYREMNEGLIRLLEDLGGYNALVPVSYKELLGVDDVYALIQQQFHASDDALKD